MFNAITEANDCSYEPYAVVIRGDSTYSIAIDQTTVASGTLGSEDHFNPALTPPKQIDDPEDEKPEDWVDEAKVCMVYLCDLVLGAWICNFRLYI